MHRLEPNATATRLWKAQKPNLATLLRGVVVVIVAPPDLLKAL
jgi:hypothetical protein